MLKTKKLVYVVSLVLAVSLFLCSGCGKTGVQDEKKETFAVNDDFADNKVCVFIRKFASNHEYSPNDFPFIDCTQVKKFLIMIKSNF